MKLQTIEWKNQFSLPRKWNVKRKMTWNGYDVKYLRKERLVGWREGKIWRIEKPKKMCNLRKISVENSFFPRLICRNSLCIISDRRVLSLAWEVLVENFRFLFEFPCEAKTRQIVFVSETSLRPKFVISDNWLRIFISLIRLECILGFNFYLWI